MGTGILGENPARRTEQIGDTEYDPRKEVPHIEAYVPAENGGRKPTYRTLPKDEWEHKRALKEAKENIDEELNSALDHGAEFVSTVDESGPWELGIEARVPEHKVEELNDALPTRLDVNQDTEYGEINVSDIPINVTQVDSITEHYKEDVQWPDNPGVPGGAFVQDINGESGYFSLNVAFEKDNGTQGWVTTGHGPENEGVGIRHGYSESDRDYIGDVEEIVMTGPILKDDPIDCAFISSQSTEDEAPWVTNSNGGSLEYPVAGVLADSELEAVVGDQQFEIHKQGVSTGHTTGHITGVGSGWAYSTFENAVGDSGGPVFKLKEEGGQQVAYIAGGVMGEVDDPESEKDGDAVFTTAEEIESQLDGNFVLE